MDSNRLNSILDRFVEVQRQRKLFLKNQLNEFDIAYIELSTWYSEVEAREQAGIRDLILDRGINDFVSGFCSRFGVIACSNPEMQFPNGRESFVVNAFTAHAIGDFYPDSRDSMIDLTIGYWAFRRSGVDKKILNNAMIAAAVHCSEENRSIMIDFAASPSQMSDMRLEFVEEENGIVVVPI